jgi:multidrug efflux pump subunit AcrB
MISVPNSFSLTVWLRRLLFLGVVVWALVATVLLLKNQPKTLLVGIDQYGARLITDQSDRLLKAEAENIAKRFVVTLLNYSAETFESQVSQAGDLISEKAWELRRDEFRKLSERLKGQEFSQVAKIQEVRQVSDLEFEIDVKVESKSRLQAATTALRYQLKLQPKKRTALNPSAFEVADYAEHVL